MSTSLVFSLCLFFVLLPWSVLLTVIINRAIADYRAWRRSGRELDPNDRDFLRLSYVALMIAMWLGGWS